MKKSLGISLLVGLMALAFAALPALASAAPHFEKEGSGVEYSGTGVGVSSNIETETSVGTLTCKKVTLTGTVKGAKIEKGSGTAETCSASGLEVKVSAISFTDELIAGGTDKATFTFNYTIPALGLSCVLKTPSATPAPTTWTNGSNVIGVGPATLEGSGLFCPTSGTLRGSLELFTSVGGTKVLTRS